LIFALSKACIGWPSSNKTKLVISTTGEWDLESTSVTAYSPDDGSYNHGEILPGAEAVLRLRRRPVYYITWFPDHLTFKV
jgi:hypothetical protein